jgi:hypothetical protein
MEFNNVINSVTITSRQFVGIGYDNISNNYSDIRTSDNLSDSLKITRDYIETNERNIDDSINIYRYKFTNDFTNELYKFSKIHQYDHRKDFKEAWEIWIDDNSNLVDDEVRRLTNLGYDGDVLDKMFKSARYYFRKKSTEKKEPVKRRIYVGSQKDLLEAMDDHIKSNISSGEFKPADGFDEFCKKNVDILKDQVNQLIRSGITDSNEIKSKIKKTYKNRYFLIISK